MPLDDTEQSSEHPGLPVPVLSGDPKHLPFANHLHRLDSGNIHRAGRRRRPRTLHGPQPTFHVTVVGFDAVIRVAASSTPTTSAKVAFTLRFSNGSWIPAQFIPGKQVVS